MVLQSISTNVGNGLRFGLTASYQMGLEVVALKVKSGYSMWKRNSMTYEFILCIGLNFPHFCMIAYSYFQLKKIINEKNIHILGYLAVYFIKAMSYHKNLYRTSVNYSRSDFSKFKYQVSNKVFFKQSTMRRRTLSFIQHTTASRLDDFSYIFIGGVFWLIAAFQSILPLCAVN